MSGFLYYMPGVPDNHPVCDGKLSYAFEGKPIGRRCTKGPDGNEGVVFGTEKVGFYEAQQTWEHAPLIDCWIGFYTDDLPNEEGLRREKTLLGKAVEIKGQQWQIPIARSFEEIDGEIQIVARLSQYIKVDFATGDWIVGDVQDEYQELWTAMLRYWDYWSEINLGESDDKPSPLTDGEVFGMSEIAMRTNYRVSYCEMSILNLFSVEAASGIMRVLIDLDGLDEHLKKKALRLASSATDNGSKVEAKTTPQPSLTG